MRRGSRRQPRKARHRRRWIGRRGWWRCILFNLIVRKALKPWVMLRRLSGVLRIHLWRIKSQLPSGDFGSAVQALDLIAIDLLNRRLNMKSIPDLFGLKGYETINRWSKCRKSKEEWNCNTTLPYVPSRCEVYVLWSGRSVPVCRKESSLDSSHYERNGESKKSPKKLKLWKINFDYSVTTVTHNNWKDVMIYLHRCRCHWLAERTFEKRMDQSLANWLT